METAATAFFSHHAWAKLAVGIAVSVEDEEPLAHLARFAEVRRVLARGCWGPRGASGTAGRHRDRRKCCVQVIRGILAKHDEVVFFASCTNAPGCAAALRRRVGVGMDVVVEFEPLGTTARCGTCVPVTPPALTPAHQCGSPSPISSVPGIGHRRQR